MVDAIKHDTASTVATGASGAVKGAAKGLGLLLGIPALIGGGLALAFGASVGVAALAALGGVAAAAGIGMLAGIPALGAASVVTGGGALIGLAKGGSKVSQENQKFEQQAQSKQHRQETAVSEAGMQGMQQGYMAGFQEGQQAIVNELRQLQEQQLMQGALAAKGGHAANVMKERAAQPAAAPQLG